jgi:hypothetical protein
MNQTEDKARFKRQRTEKAIQLAMQSRWEEAITENRTIIATLGSDADADAHNRLGKALTETGRIKEAREAYQKALDIEPANGIARKNLERLATMKSKAEPDRAQQVDTSLFIEEMGKTGISTIKPQNLKTLATLSAGDEIALKPIGSRLTVETISGEYLSDVDPKLAVRLNKLIAGGNTYAAAVAAVGGDSVRIIIKETFQHPSQAGRLSFPAGKAGDGVRPYTRESLVRSDVDEDEEFIDESEEWDESADDTEAETERGDVSLFDAAREDDADEPDFDE